MILGTIWVIMLGFWKFRIIAYSHKSIIHIVYNKIDEVDETDVRWKFIMCVFFSLMRELLSDPKILVCSQMFKQHMHTESSWATFAKQSADFVNMCMTYRDLKFKLQHSYATRHITACPYEKSKYHRFPISYQLL